MTTTIIQHYGLWELAVLCFLREAPMHPYEMQRLLKHRHKDDILVLKRGSLYHAVGRLERAELVEPIKTNREGRRPERTTYRLTSTGEKELLRWLRELIAKPKHEPSEFMVSVSFLAYLTPKDALEQLEVRAESLSQECTALAESLKKHSQTLDRIHLLETEYARAMRAAELAWVRGVVLELRKGRLHWDLKAMLKSIHGTDKIRQKGESR
jgi:DNA-binding PadR family transcriptional regulator